MRHCRKKIDRRGEGRYTELERGHKSEEMEDGKKNKEGEMNEGRSERRKERRKEREIFTS